MRFKAEVMGFLNKFLRSISGPPPSKAVSKSGLSHPLSHPLPFHAFLVPLVLADMAYS